MLERSDKTIKIDIISIVFFIHSLSFPLLDLLPLLINFVQIIEHLAMR